MNVSGGTNFKWRRQKLLQPRLTLPYLTSPYITLPYIANPTNTQYEWDETRNMNKTQEGTKEKKKKHDAKNT